MRILNSALTGLVLALSGCELDPLNCCKDVQTEEDEEACLIQRVRHSIFDLENQMELNDRTAARRKSYGSTLYGNNL